MGLSMMVLLKNVVARAKAAGKFIMTLQPKMKNTRSTMAVSAFWDICLSVACTATNAEYS